ncbi:hypothetical protein J5N97_028107 [Dioscorea zingiberensis]|uniref:Transcription initiation factor IIA gamma subunit N-terminal domain-containing protein n=1 Tax=Dioscorea zingiberensis TaxID=325984 RepID=A0A9D5H4D9_9LILI|nr:hypothetical protein J5N97_028107 [Dioscorea zingiberensis]
MATLIDLYQRSTIGMCLTETLDEVVSNGTLGPELAIQVLVQFDKSMIEAFETQMKSKVIIKVGVSCPHVHLINSCGSAWFIVFSFRTPLVSIDSHLFNQFLSCFKFFVAQGSIGHCVQQLLSGQIKSIIEGRDLHPIHYPMLWALFE